MSRRGIIIILPSYLIISLKLCMNAHKSVDFSFPNSLWKKDFELGVEREGQDTVLHFEGGFGSICAILPMRGLGVKTGAKTKI